MTDEEREQQRQSFAYGNAVLSNPDITRADIALAADRLREDAERQRDQEVIGAVPHGDVQLDNFVGNHWQVAYPTNDRSNKSAVLQLVDLAVRARTRWPVAIAEAARLREQLSREAARADAAQATVGRLLDKIETFGAAQTAVTAAALDGTLPPDAADTGDLRHWRGAAMDYLFYVAAQEREHHPHNPATDVFGERDAAQARAADLAADRDRLAAIVARLPQTADGQPIVPGMTLYSPMYRSGGTAQPHPISGFATEPDGRLSCLYFAPRGFTSVGIGDRWYASADAAADAATGR